MFLVVFGHNSHTEQDDDHHNHGDGGTKVPIAHEQELLFNQIADQGELSPTQEPRDDEGGDSWHKDHGDAGDDPRQTQGKDDLSKDRKSVGAQVFSGLNYAPIDFV